MAWLQTIGKGSKANILENSSHIRQTTIKNLRRASITDVRTEPNESVYTQFGEVMRTTASTIRQGKRMELGG